MASRPLSLAAQDIASVDTGRHLPDDVVNAAMEYALDAKAQTGVVGDINACAEKHKLPAGVIWEALAYAEGDTALAETRRQSLLVQLPGAAGFAAFEAGGVYFSLYGAAVRCADNDHLWEREDLLYIAGSKAQAQHLIDSVRRRDTSEYTVARVFTITGYRSVAAPTRHPPRE